MLHAPDEKIPSPYEIILPRITEPPLIKPFALTTNLQEIYTGEEGIKLYHDRGSKIWAWVNATEQPGVFNKYITKGGKSRTYRF